MHSLTYFICFTPILVRASIQVVTLLSSLMIQSLYHCFVMTILIQALFSKSSLTGVKPLTWTFMCQRPKKWQWISGIIPMLFLYWWSMTRQWSVCNSTNTWALPLTTNWPLNIILNWIVWIAYYYICCVHKAHQRPYFFRKLWNFHIDRAFTSTLIMPHWIYLDLLSYLPVGMASLTKKIKTDPRVLWRCVI